MLALIDCIRSDASDNLCKTVADSFFAMSRRAASSSGALDACMITPPSGRASKRPDSLADGVMEIDALVLLVPALAATEAHVKT
jgi:hypothetical protein